MLNRRMMHLNYFFNFKRFSFDGMRLFEMNGKELLLIYNYFGTITIFEIPRFYPIFHEADLFFGNGVFYNEAPTISFNRTINELYGLKSISLFEQQESFYLMTYTVLGNIKIFKLHLEDIENGALNKELKITEQFCFYEPAVDFNILGLDYLVKHKAILINFSKSTHLLSLKRDFDMKKQMFFSSSEIFYDIRYGGLTLLSTISNYPNIVKTMIKVENDECACNLNIKTAKYLTYKNEEIQESYEIENVNNIVFNRVTSYNPYLKMNLLTWVFVVNLRILCHIEDVIRKEQLDTNKEIRSYSVNFPM